MSILVALVPVATVAWQPGDANLDGQLDARDVALVDLHRSAEVQLGCAEFLAADVDADGDIDQADRDAIAARVDRPCREAFGCRPPDPMPSTFVAPVCAENDPCKGSPEESGRLARPERASGPFDLRLLSFNLDAWGLSATTRERTPLVLEILRDHRPDVVALQEATFARNLLQALNEDHPAGFRYAAAVPTESFGQVVLYRSDRFRIDVDDTAKSCCDAAAWSRAGIFRTPKPATCKPPASGAGIVSFCDPGQLPETRRPLRAAALQSGRHACGAPEQGVVAPSPPIAWVHLRDRLSGGGFHVFDLHGCPPKGGLTLARGRLANTRRSRIWSAREIAKTVDRRADSDPYFVVGDLNGDENSAVFRKLTSEAPIPDPYATFPGWEDADPHGPVPSPRLRDTLRLFRSRGDAATLGHGRRFDFVLASSGEPGHVEVCAARVIRRTGPESLRPSDHWATSTMIQLAPSDAAMASRDSRPIP